MKNILPVVMNDQFERLAVIDDYNSLIWTTRYYTCGDFELCVDVNQKNIALFAKDYFIVRDDDENVGLVERIEIQKNEDGHETLIVSGRFLPSIIGRRIIGKQTSVSGTIANCITSLLRSNIIDPDISARCIPNFVLGSYSATDTMQAQYTGDNLLDTISDICKAHGLGFKVTLNDSNQFVFSLIQGTDRSYSQSANPYVIFSDDYDNLLSSQYQENYQTIATDVLVAGEGEGASRKTLWVTDRTNLIPNNPSYWQHGGIDQGKNAQNSYVTRIRLITGIHVQPNTSYSITMSTSKTGQAGDAQLCVGIHQMTAEDGTFLHDSTWQIGTTYTFTTLPNCTFIRIVLRFDPQYQIDPADIGNGVVISMVGNDSGLNRYEIYKDQRQLQSNDGEISDAEYEQMMREAGLESISTITTAFTGTVYFGNLQWKQDVNIGDICVIENKRWGIYINSRLVEVIESVAESGQYSIIPTFGI